METEPFIFLWIGNRKLPRHSVQLGLRLRTAHPWFQAGDYVQQDQAARIYVVLLIGGQFFPFPLWPPELNIRQIRQPVDPTKSRPGNADHGEDLPREGDWFPQDRGVSAEVTAPQAITQQDYRRPVFAVMKSSAQRNRQFRNVEQVDGCALSPNPLGLARACDRRRQKVIVGCHTGEGLCVLTQIVEGYQRRWACALAMVEYRIYVHQCRGIAYRRPLQQQFVHRAKDEDIRRYPQPQGDHYRQHNRR